jgi:DNA-directed RNA polymerase specialized sigma24 family protein
MDDSPSQRPGWVLTQQSFDNLLRRLDEDRERAGQKYEQIRFRLIKFFEFRGALFPEELADETINRVARKVDEGEEIRASDPYPYFYGVARILLMQHWEKPERGALPLDELLPGQVPIESPRIAAEEETAARLTCLKHCLDALPAGNRNLIVEYYEWEKGRKTSDRDELAKRLGMTANALRIRCHRLREKLEACVMKCLKKR